MSASKLLWGLVLLLILFWVLGFALSIGEGLIHLLLVVAAVIVVYNFVVGRRSRAL